MVPEGVRKGISNPILTLFLCELGQLIQMAHKNSNAHIVTSMQPEKLANTFTEKEKTGTNLSTDFACMAST